MRISGWLKNLVGGIASGVRKVYNFFYSPLYDALGITDGAVNQWGKGLIALYYDTGTIGIKDHAVNDGT